MLRPLLIPPCNLRDRAGQSAVEFSLAFLILAVAVFGIIDVSHAVLEKHGLERAAEVVAHDLSVNPSGSGATVMWDQIGNALQDAQKQSGIGLVTAGPTTPLPSAGTLQSDSSCNQATPPQPADTACWSYTTADQATMATITLVALPGYAGTNGERLPTEVRVSLTVPNFNSAPRWLPSSTLTEAASNVTNTYLMGETDQPYGQVYQPQSN